MEATPQILAALENTKFSSDNELTTLELALDLLFKQGQALWEKGTKEREFLLGLLSGENSLSREKKQDLAPLICFMQGCLLLTLSLLNGIGRSPLAAQKTSARQYKIKILPKLQSIELTPGLFDLATENLLREFKQAFFGRVAELTFGKNDITLVKEALRETAQRLRRERAFLESLADDPLQVFGKDVSDDQAASGIFALISALPAETMNTLLLQLGSYLPAELEEETVDHLSVNVRTYFTTSTQDLSELFRKIRVLLKLYFSKQRSIIAIIVREKLQDFFRKILENNDVKNQLRRHLLGAAQEQFALRLNIFESLVKLL